MKKNLLFLSLFAMPMMASELARLEALQQVFGDIFPSEVIGQFTTPEDQEILNNRLFKAIEQNDLNQVEQLISAGADINAVDSRTDTPLMLALMVSKPEIALALIAAGANVNATNNRLDTPLTLVKDPQVALTLIAAGANVNAADDRGITPLMLATNPDVAQALINAGADVNALANINQSALFAAVFETPELVKVLLNAGAKINLIDVNGKKPFDYARDTAIQSLLLNEPKRRSTKLLEAIKQNNFEDAQAWLNNDANPNARDSEGITALSWAIKMENADIVRMLLEAGANADSQPDNRGGNPLGYALQVGDPQIDRLIENAVMRKRHRRE